jgi:hypothetical protein
MAITQLSPFAPLVLVGRQTGVTVIPARTQLTRLNYFDGKFLRAQDLQAEQRYLKSLVELSNRAGGFGVVHGFDVSLAGGDQLRLGAGLAIDPQGRVLMLPQEHVVSIQELIDRSREALRLLQSSAVSTVGGFQMCEEITETPPPSAVAGRDWWLVTIAHAEALCGEEDVYGKLCEEACVTTTDRPFWLEGVVLRVTPLQLTTPLAQSTAVALDRTHLRSLVASAYFADEAKRVGSLISRAGLESAVWCAGAAAVAGNEVPIGVLVREGGTTVFLDEWIARRERIDAPPRRYWQWRMRMRPWDVYLAHILQFQCQLHDLFKRTPAGGEDDPCAQAQKLVAEAADHIEVLASFYKDTTAKIAKMTRSTREKMLEGAPVLAGNVEKLALFQDRLVKLTQAFRIVPQERLLIGGGIVELPSAGYLPVVPGSTISVNQQVRRMLGEGVDLRFCIVRPDFVAHALEEAQHMDRISLLEGLDHPERKPKVDVLVPDGRIAPDVVDMGRFYEMRLNIDPDNIEVLALAASRLLQRSDQSTERASLATNAAANTTALLNAYLAALTGTDRQDLETFEYTGVARSQTEAGGGTSFHYAGGTRAFILGPDRLPPAPEPVPTPAPAPATDTISTNQPTGAAGATISTARFASVARLLRIGEIAQPQTRSSIWVSLDIERDPMQLTRGQSVRVKSECFVLVTMEVRGKTALRTNAVEQAGTRNFLLRLGFTGEFQVEQVARQPGQRGLLEANGVLSGELSISLRRDTAQDSYSVFLSENVRVRRTQGDSGPAFQIEMPDPSVLQPLVAELEVRREWSSATEAQALGVMFFRAPKEPQAATDILRLRAAEQPLRPSTNLAAVTTLAAATRVLQRQAFRAWQTVNPAVREPAHPAHESAIRALRSIGTVLGSTKFADLAAARLFPAPATRGDDLTVLATLDWVLFHRRRDKVCQQEIPVAPIETRHYALYHVQLAGDQTVADLAKLLQRTGAQAAGLPPLDFVQVVEFGAGIHAVVSPHVQVQASWRQDVSTEAGSILGGVIASRGVAAAEGERLAQERLESTVEVIGAVAPVDAHPDYAVLQRVPDALDVPSNDGVIILATREAAGTNCHDVVAVPRADDLKLLAAAAQEGRLQEALAGSKTAQALGKVNFAGSAAEQASLEAVKQKWNTLDFGNASMALVAANSGDAASASYPPQAAAILTALSGSGTPGLVQTPEQLSGCPAVTIVAGSVEARNALLIYTNWDNGEHFISPDGNMPNSPMEFRNDVPQGDALKNYIASLTANQPVRGVTLATTKAAPDGGANARLAAVLQELTNAGKNQTSASRRVVEPLSENDRKQLETAGFVPNNFEDIVFFELNAGS